MEVTKRFTHQHDNTPVEDSSVVAVAAGRAQERLLEDVTAAGKQPTVLLMIFRVDQALYLPSCLFSSSSSGMKSMNASL